MLSVSSIPGSGCGVYSGKPEPGRHPVNIVLAAFGVVFGVLAVIVSLVC